MSRALWTAVGGVVLVLALALGVQTWRLHAHAHDAVEAAVAPAKAAAASAQAKVETVTVQLAAARIPVLRTIHDTVPVPEHVLHPTTHDDTASAVVALPVVKAERDSIARSCSAFVAVADTYRSACDERHAADARVISVLEAQLRERPAPRHWTLGVTAGYGALLSGHTVTTGPSLTAGLTWSPF